MYAVRGTALAPQRARQTAQGSPSTERQHSRCGAAQAWWPKGRVGRPLADAEGLADEGVVAIRPGRFDEDAPPRGVAGLVIAPRARVVPLECSEGTRPTKAMRLGAVGTRRGSPSSAAIVRPVRSIEAAEAAAARDARPQGRELEQV